MQLSQRMMQIQPFYMTYFYGLALQITVGISLCEHGTDMINRLEFNRTTDSKILLLESLK